MLGEESAFIRHLEFIHAAKDSLLLNECLCVFTKLRVREFLSQQKGRR